VKRRRLFIIISASIAAVILGFLLWPSEREPEYQGVKLSVWLDRYENGNIREIGAAFKAIRDIGTNSLPFLLNWIQHETPAWKIHARQAAKKMPSLIQKNRFVKWLLVDTREIRANSALAGFQLLGSQAKPALPDLQRLVANSSPGKKQTSRRARLSIMRMEQSSPVDVAGRQGSSSFQRGDSRRPFP
jgi:hypothetical protein